MISFSEAVQKLKSGEVVAVPTETVYGLAASIYHPQAIEKVYALKKRPLDNPLIIHVAHPSQVESKQLPPDFDKLTGAFWPGSLTLVLEVDESKIPFRARAGLPTAAFRLPNHSIAQELIAETGPLVMPSANLSGKPSATCAEHVEEDFASLVPVLDGGVCAQGVESTVLCFHEGAWEIIRLGCISAQSLQEVLGYAPKLGRKGDKPLCPGQMYKHYAPKAKLHLGGHGAALIGYQNRFYPPVERFYSLGTSEDPREVMQNLYRVLRQLDRDGVEEAFVDMDIPSDGLWETIQERFLRASSHFK